MKTYLQIVTNRRDELKTVSVFLLTDNITGWIYEAQETRIFFKSANPFSFARLHINDVDFMCLMKGQLEQKVANVNTSVFVYSIIKM